jgi:transposase
MIPPAKQRKRGGRPRKVDMREVLNTLFYLNRSGCQWDMLPHDLLPKEARQNNLSISLINVLRSALCRTQQVKPLQQSLLS